MRRFINGKNNYFFVLSWCYLGILMFFSVIGDRGLLNSLSLTGERNQIKSQIIELEREIQELQEKVYDYGSNDRSIYEYAREVLHMKQDNEIEFVFKDVS